MRVRFFPSRDEAWSDGGDESLVARVSMWRVVSTAAAEPSAMGRVKSVVFSEKSMAAATVGAMGYCAYFVYNYQQGSTLPPSPVNYSLKIEEAKALAAAEEQAHREARQMALKRTPSAKASSSLLSFVGLGKSAPKEAEEAPKAAKASKPIQQWPSLSADKEELGIALAAVRKMEGGAEAEAALTQLILAKKKEKLAEEEAHLRKDFCAGRGDMTGDINLSVLAASKI